MKESFTLSVYLFAMLSEIYRIYNSENLGKGSPRQVLILHLLRFLNF